MLIFLNVLQKNCSYVNTNEWKIRGISFTCNFHAPSRAKLIYLITFSILPPLSVLNVIMDHFRGQTHPSYVVEINIWSRTFLPATIIKTMIFGLWQKDASVRGRYSPDESAVPAASSILHTQTWAIHIALSDNPCWSATADGMTRWHSLVR